MAVTFSSKLKMFVACLNIFIFLNTFFIQCCWQYEDLVTPSRYCYPCTMINSADTCLYLTGFYFQYWSSEEKFWFHQSSELLV